MIGKRKRVVIADGNCRYRNALKNLLHTSGKLKISGIIPKDNLLFEKIELFKPEVILLDVVMPELKGIQTAKKIHERYPNIKIIILTEFGDEKYLHEIIKTDLYGFISKSSNRDEFLQQIIGKKSSQRNISKYLTLNTLTKKYSNKNSEIYVSKKTISKSTFF